MIRTRGRALLPRSRMGPDEGGGDIIGEEALVVSEELQPALRPIHFFAQGAAYPVGFAADGYPVAHGCAIAQASYVDRSTRHKSRGPKPQGKLARTNRKDIAILLAIPPRLK